MDNYIDQHHFLNDTGKTPLAGAVEMAFKNFVVVLNDK
jgi:hypothetical protein